MIWILVGVLVIQVLVAWIWFWPASWWRWIERAPSGFYNSFAFFRSLPALLLSFWIAGVLALLWGGVVMVGWPRFLVPRGARRDVDRADARSVIEHPLMWLVIIAGIVGIALVAVWQRQGAQG